MALLLVVAVAVLMLFIRWFYQPPIATKGDQADSADSAEPVELDPEPRTPPLDFAGFDPGNIVSDEVFYDSSTMDTAQIADFLATTNDGCRAGGAPCITDYIEDSPSFEADDFCYDFQGAEADSAASIIAKAAQACGVNPQVLLVMLQKEQGLLTASGSRLNEGRYDIAMGFGCPDTADCNPAYFGFANQVYHAARQLRRYANEPEMYLYAPFESAEIAYHPNPECGTQAVYLENYATAGLYNYTPYQPGGSLGCESDGNLNFYAYFQAWFG